MVQRIEGRHSSAEVELPATCDRSGRALHGYAYSFGARRNKRFLDNTITLGDYSGTASTIALSPDEENRTNGNSGLFRRLLMATAGITITGQGSYVEGTTACFAIQSPGTRGRKTRHSGPFDIRIWDAETYELLHR